MSRFLNYENNYDFTRSYVDSQENDVVTAVSVMEGTAVLLTGDATDYEELTMALLALGVDTVMADASAADRLPFSLVQTKTAFHYAGAAPTASAADFVPMRAVYRLISDSIPDSFDDSEESYLRFLSDFTFRRNRGYARVKAILQNEALCACALTAAESDCAAVISGVACQNAMRGKGMGKRVVCALVHDLQQENKTVHVIALNDSASGFYQAIGFRPEAQIAWMKIK